MLELIHKYQTLQLLVYKMEKRILLVLALMTYSKSYLSKEVFVRMICTADRLRFLEEKSTMMVMKTISKLRLERHVKKSDWIYQTLWSTRILGNSHWMRSRTSNEGSQQWWRLTSSSNSQLLRKKHKWNWILTKSQESIGFRYHTLSLQMKRIFSLKNCIENQIMFTLAIKPSCVY